MDTNQFACSRKRYPISILWFSFVVILSLLVIFWDSLFSGLFIWGPDAGGYFLVFSKWRLPLGWLGAWEDLSGLGSPAGPLSISPYQLMMPFVPELKLQVATYISAVVGSILSGVFLLRGYGLKGWPAYLGAAAIGFTAHTFSLIAAGHLGKIEAFPFAVLLMACVHRAVLRRSLFFYAAAGFSAGIGFVFQADMIFLFLPFSAVYGLVLFLRDWPRPDNAAQQFGDGPSDLNRRRVRHVLVPVAGSVLLLLFFLAIAGSSAQSILRTTLPDREKLAQAVGSGSSESQNKWEFATNWSLPPEEMLEFVAPCVFGIQSGDARGPYWGRLGRALGWEKTHQGLMNLRQHTVYLGAIQIVFGCLAFVMAMRAFRTGAPGSVSKVERESLLVSCQPSVFKYRADVIFFACAFVIAVLLALGRNFPLYRLFYMVPFTENLRAPVKFLHIAEVSLCVLMAFGLDWFFKKLLPNSDQPTRVGGANSKSAKPQRERNDDVARGENVILRRFAIVCAIGSFCLLAGVGIAVADQGRLVALWSELGMAEYSERLMACMLGGLGRGSFLFLLCALAFWIASRMRSPSKAIIAVPICIGLFLVTDLTTVAKKYVTVWDEYERFAPKELLARLLQDRDRCRVSLPSQGGVYPIWQTYIFPKRLLVLTDPLFRSSLSAVEKSALESLSRDPLRLWQVTSTRDIIAPVTMLGPILKQPTVKIVDYFNVMQDGQTVWADASRGQQVWIRLTNTLPWAGVYSGEMVKDSQALVARMADPGWNPAKSVLVSSSNEVPGGLAGMFPATIVRYKPNKIELHASVPKAGILMINDRYDPDWEAFVNGKKVTVLRCNALMRGVQVPAGENDVIFLYRPYMKAFIVELIAVFIFSAWLLMWLILGIARRRAGQRSFGEMEIGAKTKGL